MSTLSKTAFEALYGLSGTTFPDNTTGEISEGDMRQFGKDISDSILFTTDDSYTKPFPQVTASGTDTYTATLSPSIAAYAAGQRYQVRFTNANTGGSTLNFNGLGAKAMVKNGSTALAAGDINAGQILLLGYDGTNMQIIGGGGGVTPAFVETVTGDGVDNTDPANPVLSFPIASVVDNTPAGGISATTVQAALNELDTEKAPLASPTFTGTPAAPTATGGTNTTQLATTAFVHDAIVGVQDIFITAAGMWPRFTNGCAPVTQSEIATSLFNIQTLDFDQTAQEFAQFQFVIPRNWNNGTITAEVYWTASTGSGGVVFGLSGGAYSNDDALSTAFGTAQTMADTLITASDVHITPTSSAITLAGSPTDADFIALQLSRNPSDGSDTLTADAKVLGILLHVTTDAGKAA